MAYGLDVNDLIYANSSRTELGTLEDYEIDLDIAGSKDFELKIQNFMLEPGYFWYVDNTEIGGIIDGYSTDPSSNEITYSGRSWRGILSSHIVYATDNAHQVAVSGTLKSIINDFLSTYSLKSLFQFDHINSSSVTGKLGHLDLYPGSTLYDIMIFLANEAGVNLDFKYKSVDKKVHITGYVSNDYSDYLTYNKDNSVSFKVSQNFRVTNHYIGSGLDENGKRRTLHLFLDDGGQLQPYYANDRTTATKDAHYITNQSKKKIKGINEIVYYEDVNINPVENYELLEAPGPKDWKKNYYKYYKKVRNKSWGDEQIFTIGSDSILDVKQMLQAGKFMFKQGDVTIKKDRYDLYKPETIINVYFDEDLLGLTVKVGKKSVVVPDSGFYSAKYSGKLSALKITYNGVELERDLDYSIEQITHSSKVKFDKNTLEYNKWNRVYNSATSGTKLATIVNKNNLDPSLANKSREDFIAYAKKKRDETKKTSFSYSGEKISLYLLEDDTVSYEPVTEEIVTKYILLKQKPVDWNNTYSYYYERSWDQNERTWTYSQVSASSDIDMKKMKKIDSKAAPRNWKNEYDQYYYKFNTGNEIVLRQYSADSEPKYTIIKSKPDDWNENFRSYYRKVYVREETVKKNGRKQKVEKEYETQVDNSKLEWKTVEPKMVDVEKDGKKVRDENGNVVQKETIPEFISKKYYIQGSKEIIPKYKRNNCYLPYSKISIPRWVENQYYDIKESVKIPLFEPNKYYKIVLDHYAGILESGLTYFSGLTAENTQQVSIDDYDLNIGDTVGGKDDLTGLTIVQTVTNIIVKLNRGMLTLDYEIGTNSEIGGL